MQRNNRKKVRLGLYLKTFDKNANYTDVENVDIFLINELMFPEANVDNSL